MGGQSSQQVGRQGNQSTAPRYRVNQTAQKHQRTDNQPDMGQL